MHFPPKINAKFPMFLCTLSDGMYVIQLNKSKFEFYSVVLLKLTQVFKYQTFLLIETMRFWWMQVYISLGFRTQLNISEVEFISWFSCDVVIF